jgi:uncharacterized protein YdaU (DUF1376 family)
LNYYERYCGDYAKKTARLTLVQHGAYTLLLDEYYSNEKPLPCDFEDLFRICRAMKRDEQNAVREVAELFFPIGPDGLRHNERADEMIARARPKMEASRANGSKGGRPRKNPLGSGNVDPMETCREPTGLSEQNPAETQGETTRARSPTPTPLEPIHTPSAPARISMAMREFTIAANPAHPSIIALAEQGIDPETVRACCAEAREAKPNESISVAYIVKKLEAWRAQAAAIDVRGAGRPKTSGNWGLTAQSMSAKARELGISDARPGESEGQFKARIQAAISAREPA